MVASSRDQCNLGYLLFEYFKKPYGSIWGKLSVRDDNKYGDNPGW